MFYFLIPLRSAETTQNWGLTCSLLGRTMKNLSAQRSQDWRIVLVYSERPDIAELASGRVSTLQVDLPVPRNRDERRSDKRRKLVAGIETVFQQAAAEADTTIMPVDADDLLSVRLVDYAATAEAENGFVVSRGYLHSPGSRFLWTHNRFYRFCGSCTAFATRRSGRTMFAGPGDLIDVMTRGGHRHRPLAMATRGRPLADVPFRGAVYSLSTGDNHSGNSLGLRWKPWRMVLASKRIGEEFPGLR